MLRLPVGLIVDGYLLNLTILTLPNRQLTTLANKLRTMTKVSFKIESTLCVSFPGAFLKYGIK